MAEKTQQSPAHPVRRPASASFRPVALTIAGSDSGGCAGIQADLKTFAALGVHGTSVVTAITAQNTRQVEAIHRIPANHVRAQLLALFADFRIGAIKTGMLASSAIITTVADALQPLTIPLVVDPVLVSTGGTPLLPARSIALLRSRLLPLATLLTPNVPEAEVLLGKRLRRAADLPHAARDLLESGAGAVLLKGGHLRGTARVRDLLVDSRSTIEFTHARSGAALRGTGCTLAAAIAAGLALGMTVSAAADTAERFVQRAIRGAYRVGSGNRHALDPIQ